MGPLSLLYKSFLWSLLTCTSPRWFPLLSATNFTKLEWPHQAANGAITGCLSFSPIPLPLSKASLPPLRVTLTHFTLLSYERAWNVSSFIIKSTLSSPCSCSDPPLSCQGVALTHLESPSLMTWYSGLTTLFSFFLARAALASLPSALSVALRPLFPFWQAQYVQVFPLKPAPLRKLFAGLGSTNKSAIFLFFSYYLTLVPSSPLCSLLHLSSYLKLSGRSGRNCLLSPPALSDYSGSRDTRFSQGMTRLMSWPDAKCYLRPLQSLVVSFLLSLVSALVFSWTGGAVSY